MGVALLFTLLKTPQALVQFAFYTSASGAMRKVSGQIMNVMHAQGSRHEDYPPKSSTPTPTTASQKITTRKVVRA